MASTKDIDGSEIEFVPVPKSEQLDRDDDGSDDTDALDVTTGADDHNLEQYKDRDGPVWGGPE